MTTQTPQEPMIVGEDPDMPSPMRNSLASFQILRMITQESLQAVAFGVMAHWPSAFTPNNMKNQLNKILNIEHYCAPVMHPTTGWIVTKYSKLANDPETIEMRTKVLENNLEASPKATIKQEQKVQTVYLYSPINK